jgi:ribosome-associated protein
MRDPFSRRLASDKMVTTCSPGLETGVRIVVTSTLEIPESELEVSFARSGGSGGQNVNKVSSKAVVRFHLGASSLLTSDQKGRVRERFPSRVTDDGDLLVMSDQGRDQKQNLDDACAKIADIIRSCLAAPKQRHATKPSKGARRRRLQDKAHRSDVKAGRGRVRDD